MNTQWTISTIIACTVTMLLFSTAHGQQASPYNEAEIAQKVDSVMQNMTLTDKVGEMTQLSIDMISEGQPYNLAEPHQLSEEKLREVLVENRVGSILNVGGHAYTVEHWQEIIKKIQDVAMNDKPTGIPVIYGIDTIHGANYTLESTLFPQQIAIAATWDTHFAKRGAEIGAYETRASYIPWAFSPVLDIGRDARWPRLWETFGEDVHLAKKMGVAMVEGYQGDDAGGPYHVAATMKHFLGYSLPITGKDRTQAWIPERQMREYVLPTFEAATEAGALTVMINSGEMNGIPVHTNKDILTGLLRDEMGFEGIAVSDWEDIIYLQSRHKVAKTHKEAIEMAVNAGVDMSMVPLDLSFPKLLKELVEEGKVPMERIDEAVRRILTVKFKLNLFENPYYEDADYDKFGSEEFANESYQAAVEAVTLLKNSNDILPLSKDANILVTGPNAHSLTALNGGWSRTWQGTDPQYDTEGKPTVLEALRSRLGESSVSYVQGTSIDSVINIDEAVHAAENNDVAVVVVGESPYTEKPGDLSDLWLPEAQRDLVDAIAETGTPIIMILVEGRPRIVSDIEPKTDAVLMGYLPGDEGGNAIADILLGEANPSGKLPITYPRYPNDLVTYDHNYTDQIDPFFGTNAFNPQWEFGHGLSYTTFEYSNMQIKNREFDSAGSTTVSIDVTNTGERSGKEVVQLYASDLVASVTPAVKRLRKFEKIHLDAGETKTVTFTLLPEDLAFVGRDNEWITEAGEFALQIGPITKKVVYKY
ncbi:MAG: glycoside hydrolase family 3 N-terminal domain-containing protein [Balneolaceae bacterium]|nr:glycoside hydrolase family 3 N-terminal domain-containing protein [Balneolaceae bacterium]